MSSAISAAPGSRVAFAAPVASDDPAPVDGGSGDAGITQNADGTIRFPDGRDYTPSVDPVTGHQLYTHHSTQANADGSVLTLDIRIDLAQDQSFSRTVKQHLEAPNGDVKEDATTTSFAADGTQVGEVTDARTKIGAKDQTEHTVTGFTAGEATHRETRIHQVEIQDAPSGEHSEAELDITGTWDNNGQPLNDQVVPIVDRTERSKYVTPKQGINTDTDRVITTRAHAAGPLDNLQYDGPMQLIVRFNGHGDEYIERELSVPITNGQADFASATVVRTDDHQSTLTKGMTQARIWGGFASSLLAVVGINLLRGNLSNVGRGLMFAGIAAGGAEMVGEGHALLTHRNDASWSRMFMAAYDTTWLGLLTHATRGRGDLGVPQPGTLKLGTALGIGGMVMSGGELGADLLGRTGLGALRNGTLSSPTGDLRSALTFLGQPSPALSAGSWMELPHFDASSQLLAS